MKISRSTVKFVMTTTTLLSKTNFGLRALFYLLSLQMPRAKNLVMAISSKSELKITNFNKSEDKQLLIGFLTPMEAEYKTFEDTKVNCAQETNILFKNAG